MRGAASIAGLLITTEAMVAEVQVLARRVAEAHIDVRRVRYARHRLLSATLSDPYYEFPADRRNKLAVIGSLLRDDPPNMSMAALERFVTSTPEGPQKFATILSQEAKQLRAMDRYERRARARRKAAISSP